MIGKLEHFVTTVFRDFPTSFLVGFLVLFGIGTVLFLAFFGWKRGAKWSAGLLLVEYMVLLLALAVLTRKVHPTRPFDLTLFWSYRAVYQSGKDALLTQNIENVGAFVPIGLLLGCAFGRMKWWKALAIGGGFSILIEVLQFVFRRGFAEFDDLFHNVLGCAIGFGVYVLVAWFVMRIRGKSGKEKSYTFGPN